MAIAENRHFEWANYQRRLKVWNQLAIRRWNYWDGINAKPNDITWFLKDTARPCSCAICKQERYSRKQKHKGFEE